MALGTNLYLTKDDYQNLINILDTVDVKGRKAAEYIAVLGAKLDLRVRNWFDMHPTGYDIIATAKTSEAYQAGINEAVAKALAERPAPASEGAK